MNLLLLGGTTEASQIARALAADGRFRATLSYAGRTRSPAPQPIACRVGGFGGAGGLAAWLREHETDLLIDATHPFAAQISRNAAAAAAVRGIPHLAVLRPPWDGWPEVATVDAAVARLGARPRRVFLTIGQQDLAPFRAAPHHYVVRSVDPPDPALLPAGAAVILARGPFAEADEAALLARCRIDALVTKNSGGGATRAKLDAARALGVEVVMIARPPAPDGPTVPDAAGALAWLGHQAALRHALRGA